MSNNGGYLIPFGVDGSQFFETLAEMDRATDKFAANAGDATTELTQGFKESSAAGENLIKTVSGNTQQLTKMREKAREVGRDVGEALSGKNVGTDFDNKIKKFTDLIGKFSAEAKKPVKFNIDTAKLEHFEKLVESGANELEVLGAVIEHTKGVMATLDPKSEEFSQLSEQVELAEGFLKEFGDTAAQVETKNKSLKVQLREMKAALADMELAGKGGTAEFRAMSIQAGELEDQIGDVASRVRVLASDTKNIDAAVGAVTALAGGFTAAQGAIALFGDENEAVNKIIQKVTGAMAVLQGVQALAQALNKDSALSVLLFSRAQQAAAVSTTVLTGAEIAETGATVAATTATNSFTAALLANPITVVLVALVAVVAAIIAFSSSSNDAKKATDDFNNSLERNAELLSLDEAALKRRTDLQVAQAKAAGASESQITKIEGNSLIERLKLREDYLKGLRSQYNDEKSQRNVEPAELKKLGAEISKVEGETADIRTEIQIKRLEVSKQLTDEEKDSQKAADELRKKAIEDEKKDLEARRKIYEQQLKFAKELRDALADAIKNQYEKERQQARNATKDRIDELNRETGLSKKAIADRAAIIAQLNKNLSTQLKEIDTKETTDRAILKLQAQQTLTDLSEEGQAREIEKLHNDYEEKRRQISEQYKDEADLREQLITAANRAEQRAEESIRKQGARDAQKANEENAILQVETAAKYLSDIPSIEEQKEFAVLEVRLKYAKKYLKLLRDQGEDEKGTVVLNAKKAVQDLEKELGVESEKLKKEKIFNFRDLIFGEHSKEENAEIDKAVKTAMDSLGTLTDFVADQYQRQIDARQKMIDAYDQSINDLESQLAKEQDLRDQGLANNVDTIQAELAAKKQAKEDEIKQQEDLQKKQNAARRAQIVIDTIAQASNLITAASEIFAALSGIPFVGVPLAITTVALMTGAFIAAKVKAFQAVGDGQKFGGGGYIDGKPHTEGGRKYRAVDGTGVVELQGGEFVNNKTSTEKYGDLLEAINEDKIAGMSDEALRGLLAGMGIHFKEETTKEAVNISRERDELKTVLIGAPGERIKPELQEINANVSFLATREREKVERWEDEKYFYTRSGNKTTKVKK